MNLRKKGNVILTALSIVLCSLMVAGCGKSGAPKPDKVQVVNPLMEVASLEEMEKYLDFSVPTLEKDVEAYIVMVFDGYPEMARICYADGVIFNMKYGSGDISGIYGGTLESTEACGEVEVSYYVYEELHYALWETGGFTYSLSGGEDLKADVAALIG
jgi:hypothetical protein